MSIDTLDSAESREQTDANEPSDSREELVAQRALLAEENQRLRDEYRRVRQLRYRHAAFGLGGCGIVAALVGVLFPDSRSILFALAGIGLFTAVLTYFLTPERIVPASVGERTYTAFEALGVMLQSELGLVDERLYLPTERSDTNDFAPVLLFVPQHTDYERPDSSILDDGFVITEDERQRGIAIRPTGAALYREFQSQRGKEAETPGELAEQLADGIVESFELADVITTAVDVDGTSVTFGVVGSAFGPVDRFDHPVASFLAVGLARTLDTGVSVEQLATPDDDRTDYLVRCSLTQSDSELVTGRLIVQYLSVTGRLISVRSDSFRRPKCHRLLLSLRRACHRCIGSNQKQDCTVIKRLDSSPLVLECTDDAVDFLVAPLRL